MPRLNEISLLDAVSAITSPTGTDAIGAATAAPSSSLPPQADGKAVARARVGRVLRGGAVVRADARAGRISRVANGLSIS